MLDNFDFREDVLKYQTDIKELHEEIQKKIFAMIPEKWSSLYLYASVIDHFDKLKTGEMFLYYFPKGMLKKRPVNVYEVPSKFNIEEEQYSRLADDLYKQIKALRNVQIQSKERAWSNITIIIEKQKYKVIYNYENLTGESFDSIDRRLIWSYRYLKQPYESFNKKEREIIAKFETEEKPEEIVYELPLYLKNMNKKMQNIRELQKKVEFVTEDTIEEIEFMNNHVPKSQILSTK